MTFFNMEPSYSIHWITVSLMFVPMTIRLFFDYITIKNGIKVDHKIHTYITGSLMVLVSLFSSWYEPASWWQLLFLQWAIFFLLFDYSLNVIRGKNFFYIDTGTIHSVSDGLYAKIGVLGTAFVKVWIILLALSLYFFFPYVTGEKTPW